MDELFVSTRSPLSPSLIFHMVSGDVKHIERRSGAQCNWDGSRGLGGRVGVVGWMGEAVLVKVAAC